MHPDAMPITLSIFISSLLRWVKKPYAILRTTFIPFLCISVSTSPKDAPAKKIIWKNINETF